MNRLAYYVFSPRSPRKVYGSFATRQAAEAYAAGKGVKGVVTQLTGNDILFLRINVAVPRRA